MTYANENPKAEWKQVMSEAVKHPFNAGLIDVSIGAVHFAGAAVTGSPFLAKAGIGWTMMGASYFATQAESITNPGPADKIDSLSSAERHASPRLSWRQVTSECVRHPFKTGAVEVGLGVAGAGLGAVSGDPILVGGGAGLVAFGSKRMSNYFAGIRYPQLVA